MTDHSMHWRNKHTQIIPDADEELRKLCIKEAEKIYGSPLPSIVSDRVDLELSAIEKNGYDSHYLIGQMIAEESLKKGYPVAARGMISSSFVAFLCHMTSVNPLIAHYWCDKCHHFESEAEKVSDFKLTGYDLVDKVCPRCGSLLSSDGADIYSEIAMGYDLDREPEIILNVASEIRPYLISFLKGRFGENSLFRVGVKVMLEDGSIRRNVHPGGILILPDGEDIAKYTTLRDAFPDDDYHLPITETDYHDLYNKIKRYDLLTIPELSILRALEIATGYDSRNIKMNDGEVLEVFLRDGFDYPTERNNEILQEIQGTAIKMTNPHSFSDLVRVSGMMRGTGTWENNGEILIQEGKVLNELITCRDDIMQYLIDRGLEKKHSYNIMNQIRRGKGLTDDMEHDMRNADVPDWYIESCNKIKYLFPRSHVVEYMLLYWKLAYYRLHYPDIYERVDGKYSC